MTALKLTLLGRPQVLLDDQPIPDLNSSKAQALLFYLAVTRQRHSRQELAGLLWSDKTEERARNNLRVEITRVRPLLAEYLDIQRPSLRLRSSTGVVCDVTSFLELVEASQPTLRQLQTAVDLYQGDFLEDFNLPDALLFDEWAQERRAYFREHVLEALYQITEYHGHQKNYRAGIEAARRLLDLEPWLEKAHRQLMWMLAKSGDRAAALVQYESCYELLAEELGVEPEAETIELYEQIKSGEITSDEGYEQLDVLIAPPFQVPKLTENFVGRQRDMAWLLDKLTSTSDDEPVAVVGMGGLGKTTLAIAVCHELRDEFVDGVLWANVANSDPAAILEDWAQAFGYDFSRLPDVDSRAAAFRGVLAEKQVLMVLDDVVSLARIRPLLPQSRSVKVLITTRELALAYNLTHHVRELVQLSAAQAGQLLTQIVGNERTTMEAEAAQEICDLLQNLPLAVEIVGQRLRLFRSMTLAEMADRLHNERQRLAELELSDQAVQASFAISYRALDSYEKRAFALMGVFNGRSFPREAFAAVAELDYFTAGDRLFSLEGASLVQVEDGRFQQHSLLADFACEKLEESGEIDEGYNRYSHYHLQFAQDHQHDYDILRPEWDNMMAAIEAAYEHKFWPLVISLTHPLQDAWAARGRYNEAQRGYRRAVEAARTLQDDNSLASCLLHWGKVCIEQGEYEEAAKHLNESLALARRLADKATTAAGLDALAHVYLEETRYDDAIQLLTESRQLWTELDDQKGVAASLYWEGRVLSRTYAHEEVRTICQRALVIQNEIEDWFGALQTLRLLARVAIFEEQYDIAESYCQQSLTLCDMIQDSSERANTLYTLSVVHARKNELKEAFKVLEEGQMLFRRMGNQKMYGLTFHALSGIEERQGDLQKALQANWQSKKIFEDLGDLHNLVYVLLHRSKLHLKTEQLVDARQVCLEALKFAQANNHPEKTNIELLSRQIEQKTAKNSYA